MRSASASSPKTYAARPYSVSLTVANSSSRSFQTTIGATGLEIGPFYAVKVVPGSFGTFAGVVTDASARVLDGANVPIPGLYAVGSDQASVMGGHYPAGGINIGPAMTFGYVAAVHATRSLAAEAAV